MTGVRLEVGGEPIDLREGHEERRSAERRSGTTSTTSCRRSSWRLRPRYLVEPHVITGRAQVLTDVSARRLSDGGTDRVIAEATVRPTHRGAWSPPGGDTFTVLPRSPTSR